MIICRSPFLAGQGRVRPEPFRCQRCLSTAATRSRVFFSTHQRWRPRGLCDSRFLKIFRAVFAAVLSVSGLLAAPTLTFSTFLGAEFGEVANGVALDADGNVYIVGQTRDLPAMPGSVSLPGPPSFDIFVAKFNPEGNELLYLALFGGTAREQGTAIAVDDKGAAYVTGWAFSTDFPTTAGSVQPEFGGGTRDAFVAKLSPDGSRLEYATYLGGERFDDAAGIAVDAEGNAYVVGATGSGAFPTTEQSLQPAIAADSRDAFIAKLSPDGSSLIYSTFLGGTARDEALALTLNGTGVVVVGLTESADFPVTGGSYQPEFAQFVDAYVCQINADGSAIEFATFFGGDEFDEAKAVTLGADGSIFVAGKTRSTDLPTSDRAFQSSYGGGVSFGDIFVAKFSANGDKLLRSSYIGGSSEDEANGIFVNELGDIFLAGTSGSTDFPITAGAIQSTLDLLDEAVLVQLKADFTEIEYSTYMGGNSGDRGFAIAGTGQRTVLMAGTTSSSNFPSTPDSYQPVLASFREGGDAYVAKFDFKPEPRFSSSGLVNAATLEPGPIAPGQIFSIFGQAIGPTEPTGLRITAEGGVSTEIAGTRVIINGSPAPMLFAFATQINAIVPFDLGGERFVDVAVEVDGVTSDSRSYFVSLGRPGIFTLTGSGLGQAAALNEDFTVNGPANPARAGSIVQVFATGGGATTPASVDGALTTAPFPVPNRRVGLAIGGQPAEILYGAAAPGLVAGVIQVNARVPASVRAGDNVRISLMLGEAISPFGATIAVK